MTPPKVWGGEALFPPEKVFQLWGLGVSHASIFDPLQVYPPHLRLFSIDICCLIWSRDYWKFSTLGSINSRGEADILHVESAPRLVLALGGGMNAKSVEVTCTSKPRTLTQVKFTLLIERKIPCMHPLVIPYPSPSRCHCMAVF